LEAELNKIYLRLSLAATTEDDKAVLRIVAGYFGMCRQSILTAADKKTFVKVRQALSIAEQTK
jgi:hypothetical protein